MAELDDAVLAEIAEEVESLDPDALRLELQKHLAREETRKAKQADYNKSPEAMERRKAYYEKTKDKRAEYNRKRNAKVKLLVQAAKEAGIYDEIQAQVAAETAQA